MTAGAAPLVRVVRDGLEEAVHLGHVAVGDVDGNGTWEIFAPADNGRLHGITETGGFMPGLPVLNIPFTGTSRAPSPAIIDLYGDGQREILCAGTDGQLRILRNNGSFYPGRSAVRFTTTIEF